MRDYLTRSFKKYFGKSSNNLDDDHFYKNKKRQYAKFILNKREVAYLEQEYANGKYYLEEPDELASVQKPI